MVCSYFQLKESHWHLSGKFLKFFSASRFLAAAMKAAASSVFLLLHKQVQYQEKEVNGISSSPCK